MKILNHLKINWRSHKIKVIVGGIISLLIVITAIILGVILSTQNTNKISKKEPLTQIEDNINNKKQDAHKVNENITIIDKKGGIIHKKTDITKINQINQQKEILKDYLKNKEEKNKDQINNTNENLNKPIINVKNVDDKNKQENSTKLKNNDFISNNDKNNKINENNNISYEEKPFKLKRFNIINVIAKNKDLYQLLDFKTYFSNENINNDIKFNEKLFIKNIYEIVKSAISSFQEFCNIMQYIKIDIKYKFNKDAKNIIVIANWLFDNYNIKNETRYYEEFVLSIN
ncbi:unique hypothetical [Ureaplasma parvum serovar 3 str. ATCC 700970]|uniref:Unique hypothetical n=1 Tax=Ureaplasma parvum serovar 3 (strain ATCC 700970) TaxID=273119 RepID=Q9PPY5_UREPA|nr:DUF5452 domain-containing protein [Ureaplasma parvum]pir/F82881/ hypothetical protein UU505 [imported] - Ureaplasma urealyticum [Ureaplasma urealyticum]AAF30917.1 unique hypothetical [Ureaplasma parvum serovar 3 str. ATCC 700970]UIU28456.1 DUF5452 family protein [Ureaplasma parvum]BAO73538.1 hypothetical protein UU505 [Ureaplasma parvum serovar 3]